MLTFVARGLVILIAMYPAWAWGWLLGGIVAGKSGADIGSWIGLIAAVVGLAWVFARRDRAAAEPPAPAD